MAVVATCVKDFMVAALRSDQRIDGRRPFDSRRLNIKFAREDGAAEVQLGFTHVLAIVSAQIVQPYPERPNEGTLVIYTEFSPMADPTFEPGKPGEHAVELGRVIDRGLRESRAVDTESLCILAGKAVWSLRIDIHILDNGGNMIDAANIAALAALLSFRRPECSIGGPDVQEVIIHPPEVREPLSLIIHHLPIAVSFAFFAEGELVAVDPTYKEELVMGGRLTVIVNTHGDICAIQKGGGVTVSSSEIMRCLRIAFAKATDITSSLKKAIETYELERAQRKIKRHKTLPSEEAYVAGRDAIVKGVTAGLETRKVTASQDMIQFEDIDLEDTSSDDEEDESDTDEEEVVPKDTKSRGKQQAIKIVNSKTAIEEETLKSEASQRRYYDGGQFPNTLEMTKLPFGTKNIEMLEQVRSCEAHFPSTELHTKVDAAKLRREGVETFQQQSATSHELGKLEIGASSVHKVNERKDLNTQPLNLLDAVKKSKRRKD